MSEKHEQSDQQKPVQFELSDELSQVKKALKVIEMEINSRCNRSCGYCPVSILPKPPVPLMMPDNVLDRVLEELGRFEYDGRISYHFYNEPLLRKDLVDVVAKVKSHLRLARQVLFTNGDLLTDKKFDELNTAGIDFTVVTAHDNKKRPERVKQFVQYPSDLELTNRAGTVSHLSKVTDEILVTKCFAPSEMLIVTVTGDVVLCYEDASRTTNFGNIVDDKIEDIWFSEEFVAIRSLLQEGRRASASPLCNQCTNQAHTKEGCSDSSEPFWKDIK